MSKALLATTPRPLPTVEQIAELDQAVGLLTSLGFGDGTVVATLDCGDRTVLVSCEDDGAGPALVQEYQHGRFHVHLAGQFRPFGRGMILLDTVAVLDRQGQPIRGGMQ